MALAYRIIKELSKCWKELDITVAEGIASLSELCQMEVLLNGQTFQQIPTPNDLQKKLLQLAQVNLPEFVPPAKTNITTKKKLSESRKIQ